MKVQRLILLVSVLVQLALLTGANGDNGRPSAAQEDVPMHSPDEESAKERGMKDRDW